jgi:hypothetical protein
VSLAVGKHSDQLQTYLPGTLGQLPQRVAIHFDLNAPVQLARHSLSKMTAGERAHKLKVSHLSVHRQIAPGT